MALTSVPRGSFVLTNRWFMAMRASTGCTKQEEEAYIEMIQDFTVEPVSKLEMEESYDDFAYLYGEHSRIWNYEVRTRLDTSSSPFPNHPPFPKPTATVFVVYT